MSAREELKEIGGIGLGCMTSFAFCGVLLFAWDLFLRMFD